MKPGKESVISFAEISRNPQSDTVLLAAHARLLEENGYVHATCVPEGFDHEAFLSRFGAFRPGPSGAAVEDVVPETGMDDVYYGGNRMALLPHTEGYEVAGLPPRLLALWCVVPPTGRGGETTLFDTRPVLEKLPPEDRAYMEGRAVRWHASAGLQRLGIGEETEAPMLQQSGHDTVLRFSLNNVVIPDDAAPAVALQKLLQREFDRAHVAVRYRERDLLLWDNWRVLHSRTGFSDTARHLRRVQISPAGV